MEFYAPRKRSGGRKFHGFCFSVKEGWRFGRTTPSQISGKVRGRPLYPLGVPHYCLPTSMGGGGQLSTFKKQSLLKNQASISDPTGGRVNHSIHSVKYGSKWMKSGANVFKTNWCKSLYEVTPFVCLIEGKVTSAVCCSVVPDLCHIEA